MPFEELLEFLKKVLRYYTIQKELKIKYNTIINDCFRIEIDKTYYDIECFHVEDPDTYRFNLLIKHIVRDKNKSVPKYDQLYFDPDGNFSLEYNDICLFEFEDLSEWLTEETYFQQNTVIDFGKTDVEYWKNCILILEKIYKVIYNVHYRN